MTDKERAEDYYEDNECYSYLAEIEDFEEVFGFVKDRVIHAHLDGLTEGRKLGVLDYVEKLEKENEQLKTELMHLKGCEQCRDRPIGEIATVCPTEYEDHCIGQKITHIKELEAQNKDLCESLDIMNSRESELLEQIEKLRIEIEENKNIITELKIHCMAVDKVNFKLRCCGNCNHQKYDFESKHCEYDETGEKKCVNKNLWEFAE